jgi:hypothetical protein
VAFYYAFVVSLGYAGHVEGHVVESKEEKDGILSVERSIRICIRAWPMPWFFSELAGRFLIMRNATHVGHSCSWPFGFVS